ncbi:hypothetical protein [Thioflexithrix psekupsensis]|uniref:Uncharacterized protein n=1 Tax=Thioflexithrix psekupsensis TaxID=1570016 RepID=A0A251X6K4_9GAMM|nr:hypothetical protein [Thioflexithrix psekupsensis]OUD12557.1 hypothetical protein TPSD3_15845 [Thioflexithrix psekupsensis]
MSLDYCILNELSYPFVDQYDAKKGLETFVRTYQKIGEIGLKTLRLPAEINSIHYLPLAPNYLLLNYLNDSDVNIDIKDRIREILTDAPFIHDDEFDIKEKSENSEFRFQLNGESVIAQGLGVAYLLDTLCLSFNSQEIWDCDFISLLRIDYEKTEQVKVKHSSKPEHFTAHKSYFEQKKRDSLKESKELWQRRAEFFPHLEFLKQVEQQLELCGLSKHFFQIIERLKKLNNYAEKWKQEGGAYNNKVIEGLDVTGESVPTLNKYADERTFRLPNGEKKIFEQHIKTGDLRIHFYPDNQTRKIYVGYIGKHLRI